MIWIFFVFITSTNFKRDFLKSTFFKIRTLNAHFSCSIEQYVLYSSGTCWYGCPPPKFMENSKFFFRTLVTFSWSALHVHVLFFTKLLFQKSIKLQCTTSFVKNNTYIFTLQRFFQHVLVISFYTKWICSRTLKFTPKKPAHMDAPLMCGASLVHSKLIFCEYTTNYSWGEHGVNIIF